MADGGKVIIKIDGDSSGFDKSADGVQKSAKSAAATLAAVYKKAGMDSQTAMTKAWKKIKTETKDSTVSTRILINKLTEVYEESGMSATEAAEKARKQVLDKITKGVKEIKEKAKEAGKDVENQAEKSGTEVANNAKSAGKKIEKVVDEAGEKAKAKAKETAEVFSENYGKIQGFAGKAVKTFSVGLTAAAGAAVMAAESTREYREDMSRLDSAFVSANKTVSEGREAYSDFYKILGESDRSVEAVNHLAELCNNQKELKQWTTICAGVSSKFGDSLPIEGLTEAANETAKVAKVTGPLADAINWTVIKTENWNKVLSNSKPAINAYNAAIKSGASQEDALNAALEKVNTAQERSKLITQTLADTYSGAADNFNQMNKDVMASREASQKFEDAMAKMGASVDPIITKLKNFGADALNNFADFFTDVINGEYDETLRNIEAGILAVGTAILTLNVAFIVQDLVNAFQGLDTTTKLVTEAQALFNAVLNTNPIILVTTAIIGLVAALAAWEGGLGDLFGSDEELDEATQKMIESFETAADEALKIAEDTKKSFQSITSDTDTSLVDVQAQKLELQGLTDELYRLQSQSSLTATEKQRMCDIVSKLNTLMPGLNLQLDTEAGKLNLTKEKVQEYITAKMQMAQADVIVKAYTKTMEQTYESEAKMIETGKKLEEVGNKLREVNLKKYETEKIYNNLRGDQRFEEEKYRKIIEEETVKQEKLRKTYDDLTKSITDSKTANQDAYDYLKNLCDVTGQDLPEGSKTAETAMQTFYDNMLEKGDAAVRGLQTSVKNVCDQDYTVNVKVKVTGEEKLNNIKNIDHNATGTSYAKGGLSVVNEIGQELIQGKDGSFRYVESNGPALTVLNRGDKVFTAAQSKAMLRAKSIRIPGFANGLNNELATKSAASINLGITFPTDIFAKNTVKGIAYYLKKYKSYIVDAVKSIVIDARTEVQKVQDGFNETILNEEQFYLNEKARIEKENYEKEYQEKLNNAKTAEEIQKVKNERIEEEEKKAQDKYLELLKEAADREKELYEAHQKDIENIKNDIIDSFTESAESAFDTVEDLINARDELAKKLSETDRYVSVKFVQGKETIFESSALPDLELQYKELEQYDELLQKLKERGNLPDGLYEYLQSLDREEGINYMTALLNASDADYEKYIKYYDAINKRAESIATLSYEEKAKQIKNLILTEFSKTPEELYNIGEESALEFGEGFMNKLKEAMSQTRQKIESSINAFFAPFVGSAGSTTNYYDNSQITINAGKDISAREIVEEVRDEKEYQQHREGLSDARN